MVVFIVLLNANAYTAAINFIRTKAKMIIVLRTIPEERDSVIGKNIILQKRGNRDKGERGIAVRVAVATWRNFHSFIQNPACSAMRFPK